MVDGNESLTSWDEFNGAFGMVLVFRTGEEGEKSPETMMLFCKACYNRLQVR